ncbi:MAG: DUF1622 domain-containing protein [Crocinitomix sp.]|nr:DUF1622 domain-containing protein [Crocinitomix sp.]
MFIYCRYNRCYWNRHIDFWVYKIIDKIYRERILKTPLFEIQKIRCELGIYILLSLDFLIASDIIHTIMKITTEELIELSVMIILRIAIGHFLGKEIEEIHNKE